MVLVVLYAKGDQDCSHPESDYLQAKVDCFIIHYIYSLGKLSPHSLGCLYFDRWVNLYSIYQRYSHLVYINTNFFNFLLQVRLLDNSEICRK